MKRIQKLWKELRQFLLRRRGLYCSACNSYEVRVANRQMESSADLDGMISIVEKYDVTCVACGQTHVGFNLT